MASQELDFMLNATSPLIFGVSKQMMAQGDLGAAAELLEYAAKKRALPKLAGRLALLFPEYDSDKREVFEVPEIKRWLHQLEDKYPYLSVLLEPSASFKILMFTHIAWKRAGMIKKQIVGDPEQTMGFMLQSGMDAFQFAKWQRVDAKAFASSHLERLGLGEVVNDDLLNDYERNYLNQNRS